MRKLIYIFLFVSAFSQAQIINSYAYTAEAGDAYGPEINPNAGFDTNTNNSITSGCTITWNNGVADFNATTANHRVSYELPVDPGSTYRFSWDAKRGTISGLQYSVYDRTNNVNILNQTSYTVGTSVFENTSVEFTAPPGCVAVWIYPSRDSGIGTAFFDNVSLKKVL